MKRIGCQRGILQLAIVASLSIATDVLATTAAVNDPSDIQAIKLVEQALGGQLSARKAIEHYSPQATLINTWSTQVTVGRAAIEKALTQRAHDMESTRSEFIDEDILSDGTLACAAMQVHATQRLKDGKTRDITFRQLDGLRKINGTWLIVHQHVSLPVDAMTQKVVLNGPLPARGPIEWGSNPLPGPRVPESQGKSDARKWEIAVSTTVAPGPFKGFLGPEDGIQIYDIFYPGTMRGWNEIAKQYESLWSVLKSATIKMPYFSADSSGLLSILIDTQEATVYKKDGSKQTVYLRENDCLRYVDGKAYAFFQMLSFPIDPATGKAMGIDAPMW